LLKARDLLAISTWLGKARESGIANAICEAEICEVSIAQGALSVLVFVAGTRYSVFIIFP
jgi:hypothetical protein